MKLKVSHFYLKLIQVLFKDNLTKLELNTTQFDYSSTLRKHDTDTTEEQILGAHQKETKTANTFNLCSHMVLDSIVNVHPT